MSDAVATELTPRVGAASLSTQETISHPDPDVF
jgi:hypothetical protein